MRILALTSVLLFGASVWAQEAEISNITAVGFQQLEDASRVFVRTTEPVKFTAVREKPDLVVLNIANVKVAVANNARPLDTSFFKSPVRYIRTKVIEGPSSSVRIEITVRKDAQYKENQADNILALDFTR